ncbi:MAG: PBP1A family penicillin-binding protein [Clostridiales bacterium]|nr:PBP1A family penicillin-binding protein [Clostridiales bacterium]
MNEEESKRKGPKKAGRIAKAAVNVTVDTISGTIGSVFKVLGTILLIFLITGLLFACIFAYYVKTCLTPNTNISLEDYKLSESSTIYYQDSSGQWQELVTLAGKQKRIWVDYEQIPWYMEKALVAIEDKRFYDHKGVDWYRTAGAFVEMFAKMETSYGGSTITQQLIKNLTGKDDVTIQRKLTEIFGALELEKKYDKEEIVEWYLNAVYFGEGCWGVQTAAETYFGKDVSELTLAEAACIVGITNKPTLYDPFYNEEKNKERQETILREMYDQGYIDYQTYIDAVNEDISSALVHSPGEEYSQEIYTYYEEMVIDDVITDLMELKGISYKAASSLLYNGGYSIYCCIDPNIQAIVDNVYQNVENIPTTYRSSQQLQSSIVIMDPYTGEVKAISGGVGEKTINFGLNRATKTQRPPGSSFKPIASYGPATELGYITPTTMVNDSAGIHLSGTSWYPNNDGGGHMGAVSILQALQYSLNTVAAQIIDKIGPQTAYDFLQTRLGVTSLVPDDCSYAPMALGQLTNGITVREMAQAYCSFVNDGIFTYARSYTKVLDSDGSVLIDNTPETIVAFSPNTAHVMTYMLQNATAYGTGGEAYLGTMPVAGKTGTSTDYKDRWYVGCTPYYVAAVWTGYDQPERISCYGNPAAQIFKKIMRPIHEGLEYKSFPWPYIGGPLDTFGVEEEEEEEDETIIEGDDGTISGDGSSGGNSGGGSETIPEPPDTDDDNIIIIG